MQLFFEASYLYWSGVVDDLGFILLFFFVALLICGIINFNWFVRRQWKHGFEISVKGTWMHFKTFIILVVAIALFICFLPSQDLMNKFYIQSKVKAFKEKINEQEKNTPPKKQSL